jgi:hypothetical protein
MRSQVGVKTNGYDQYNSDDATFYTHGISLKIVILEKYMTNTLSYKLDFTHLIRHPIVWGQFSHHGFVEGTGAGGVFT